LLERTVDAMRAPDEEAVEQLVRSYPHFCAPERLARGDDHGVIDALRTVMTERRATVDYLVARIDALADAAMPPNERPAKISALESELAQLQALEVHFVNAKIEDGATGVTFDPQVSPAVLLGILVVQGERARLAS
jgi:hypothetical protein